MVVGIAFGLVTILMIGKKEQLTTNPKAINVIVKNICCRSNGVTLGKYSYFACMFTYTKLDKIF